MPPLSRALVLVFSAPLSGCLAVLTSGEVGPAFQANGGRTLFAAEGNAGLGLAMESPMGGDAGLGGGLTARVRTDMNAWTALEAGPHVFAMQKWSRDYERWNVSWLRAGLQAGAVFVPGRVYPISTPTLEPGHAFCGYVTPADFCLGVSVPIGVDLAPATARPGFTLGIQLSLGMANAEIFRFRRLR